MRGLVQRVCRGLCRWHVRCLRRCSGERVGAEPLRPECHRPRASANRSLASQNAQELAMSAQVREAIVFRPMTSPIVAKLVIRESGFVQAATESASASMPQHETLGEIAVTALRRAEDRLDLRIRQWLLRGTGQSQKTGGFRQPQRVAPVDGTDGSLQRSPVGQQPHERGGNLELHDAELCRCRCPYAPANPWSDLRTRTLIRSMPGAASARRHAIGPVAAHACRGRR